ncbi:hypothetical protein [Rosistilla oblonga]|nr:hypothetical protein [Rosistilla oblonga]
MKILEQIDVDVQAVRLPVLLKIWSHLDAMATPTFQRESPAVQWPDDRNDAQPVTATESEVQA